MLQSALRKRNLLTKVNQSAFQGFQPHFRGLSTINDSDKPLRDDIRKLGAILGQAVKAHDPVVFENVEKLRALGRQVRK
jgi:hypothetical protein